MAGHAGFTTSGLGAGVQTATAVYNGDSSFAPSTSTPATITVLTTSVITGNHPGELVVAAGTTVLLNHATIRGSVNVEANGSLDIEGSTLVGSITATSPGAIRICGSTVGGAVKVTWATGFVLIRDPGDDGCTANSFGGALIVQNNHHGAAIIGNRVPSVIASGNSGAGAFPQDTAPGDIRQWSPMTRLFFRPDGDHGL